MLARVVATMLLFVSLKWFVGRKLKELCVDSASVCASVCGCLDVVLSEAGYHAARGALMQCHLGI